MITKSTELHPFTVPNYVIQKVGPRPRQEGLVEAPKYHLSEVGPGVLALLCDEFRASVFAKAGRRDPGASSGKR